MGCYRLCRFDSRAWIEQKSYGVTRTKKLRVVAIGCTGLVAEHCLNQQKLRIFAIGCAGLVGEHGKLKLIYEAFVRRFMFFLNLSGADVFFFI